MLLTSKEFVEGGGAVNLVLVNMWQHSKFQSLHLHFTVRSITFGMNINYVTLQYCVMCMSMLI
jgi:hypothetical protein